MGKKFRRQDGWSGVKTRHLATYDWVNNQLLGYALLAGDNAMTGNNTFSGDNTFSNPVTIPDGVAPTDAASYGQISGFATAISDNATDILNIQAVRDHYWQYIGAETLLSQAVMYDCTYVSCICKAAINVIPQVSTLVQEFHSSRMPGGIGLGPIDYSVVSQEIYLSNLTTSTYDDLLFNPGLQSLYISYIETVPGYDFTPLVNLNTYDLYSLTCAVLLGVPGATEINIATCSAIDLTNVNAARAFSQIPLDVLHVEYINGTLIDLSNQVFNGGTAQCIIYGCTALTTIAGDAATYGSGCIYYDFGENALTVPSVDDILQKVNMFAGMIPNGDLYLDGGTNAAPTGGAANTDVVALQGNGWTVTHN